VKSPIASSRLEGVRAVRAWLAAVSVSILCAHASSLHALDPSRTLTQSVHRIWQVQQGLPQAWIYSIAQTGDGYLWLGTQTGLVKFDGVRFTMATDLEGLPSENLWVTHLIEEGDNILWIGTAQAGLFRLEGGTLSRFAQAEGLPSGPIQCLFHDRQGTVWVCTPSGLASLTQGTVRVFSAVADLPSADVRAACVAPDGTLFVGAGDSRVHRWDGTQFLTPALPMATSAEIRAMLCASDGTVWIGTASGLIRVRGGDVDRLTRAEGLADDSILTLTETRDGGILVGTSNGFSRIRARDIDSFRPQDGLSQSTVYSLYEDSEGSLWVATKHGLNQFLDSRAVPYTTSEGLPSNDTGPVLEDDRGTIWVGTLGGGLARFDGRTFTTLTSRDGLTSNSIFSLAEDRSGDLWVGTDSGLNRLKNGRVAGTWTTREGLPGNHVRALYADHAGTIWIATNRGPATFQGGAVRPVVDRRGSVLEPILAFGEDGGDRLLAAPDVASPVLNDADAIYRDSEGLVWVGTLGQGLRLIDGDRTYSFTVLDGLFDDVIYGIVDDGQGRLWLACSKGIFSLSRFDLRQFAAGEIQSFVSTPYSPLDALRTVEAQPGVQPAVMRTRSGQLWFATVRGVIVIDPEHFERKLVPPTVTVERVVVNGVSRRAAEIGTLPAGPNNLEFSYTGASFITPLRISFRHMLEGLDNDWVEAGSRREAFYTNLPPGRFRFRVVACIPDGTCRENVAAVNFSVAPHLYQRAWFLPLCLSALGLVGVGLYQLRIRRLREQFNLILTERGRIARELHDTLIQGFSGITMALQAVVSRLPVSSERASLEDIVADAGHAMKEARRSLMGLRRSDSASGLATAVAQTARQLTEANDVRLKLDLGDCQWTLTSDVEDNLLRIAQEALMNAVKHSGARTLQVTLDGTPQRIQLSVKDDGAGFDGDQPTPAGHYGLMGMRERAAQIGARLRIVTAPGRGTAVSVVLET
jgi:ligand-binding sensor domain-containing protein/two-component sensor histidine kinase